MSAFSVSVISEAKKPFVLSERSIRKMQVKRVCDTEVNMAAVANDWVQLTEWIQWQLKCTNRPNPNTKIGDVWEKENIWNQGDCYVPK